MLNVSAIGMVGIAILFGNFMSARPKQKLFPHFSEARTVIFVIEIVEQSGHDQTSLFSERPTHPARAM
jgi:hypothetical protein